jgi:hypothetical protein
MERRQAPGVETRQPAMGALTRNSHRLGYVRYRHSLVTDPFDKKAPAVKRQSSITVTHEDLRVVKTDISTAPEVFF